MMAPSFTERITSSATGTKQRETKVHPKHTGIYTSIPIKQKVAKWLLTPARKTQYYAYSILRYRQRDSANAYQQRTIRRLFHCRITSLACESHIKADGALFAHLAGKPGRYQPFAVYFLPFIVCHNSEHVRTCNSKHTRRFWGANAQRVRSSSPLGNILGGALLDYSNSSR